MLLTSRIAKSTASQATAISLVAALAWAQPCQAQIQVPGTYPTIQAAVDAATSGMTITVAAGIYEEQVIIDGKNLTLQGMPGATVQSPPTLAPVSFPGTMAPPRRPVLAATNCNVDIDGLAFDGLRRGGDNVRFTGVLYVGSGGSVTNCSFTGFRPQSAGPLPFNPNPERAFQLANNSGLVGIAIRQCTFTDNVGAIFMSGPQGTDPNAHRINCDIADNTIVGLGPQPFQAQSGIHVSAGARGVVRGNHVSRHVYVGNDNFSIAIVTGSLGLAPGFVMQPVLIVGNTTVNNNAGVLSLFADRSVILDNDITGGMFGFTGIALSGNRNWVLHNSVDLGASVVAGNSGVALLGDEFNVSFGSGYATNTRVVFNTISGADLPIWSQTGVTGTFAFANQILP